MAGTPEFLRDLQFWSRRTRATLFGGRFSTFAEQEIIDRYIDEFHIDSHVAVDIGAGDGIRGSNTYSLFRRGWKGIGIEADATKYRRLQQAYSSFADVVAVKAAVQPDNIIETLVSHGIDRDFGVLSLDIDGNDYWVLDAILSEFRPRLIVSEYNEKIPPPVRFVVKYDPAFSLRHHFFGYSIAKLDDLLTKHDYALLEVEYNNVFLAPAETPGARGLSPEVAYARGYASRPDRRERFATNENMEALHAPNPDEAVRFLNAFYREHEGKYEIDIAK
jgi:hypothetical protein